jgi:transcriptional regulator with XRE-family HTH domain
VAWGDRLRDLRIEKGFTQATLAAEAGGRIDQTAISRWERGHPIPDDAKVRVARALGVNAMDLFPLDEVTEPIGENGAAA